VALALALAAAPAEAASLGQTSATNQATCGNNAWLLQNATAAAPAYAAPSDGVILSWSTLARAGAGQQMQLKIFRVTGAPGEYRVVGASAVEALTPSAANTFATHIAVKAGDLLGEYSPGTSASVGCDFGSSDFGDSVQFGSNDPATGSTVTPGPGQGSFRLNVSATFEPDADGDGFGDETQDQCPTDATTQAPCRADLSVAESASTPFATLGRDVTFTAIVKNNHPTNPARGVSVGERLTPGLTLVSATGGTCAAGTCSLGDLPGGASATVTFVAHATGTGAQSATAVVASQTVDPSPANDAATATTTAFAPFKGVKLRSSRLTVKNGKVRVPVVCPAGSAGNCAGTDTLSIPGKVVASAKVRLGLGKARFSIRPGKSAKITIKLTKAALKLLAKKPIKVRQQVVARDSRGTSKTSTGTLTLAKR
jgi:uncharacterized repeat protein (TIGR01451 family)